MGNFIFSINTETFDICKNKDNRKKLLIRRFVVSKMGKGEGGRVIVPKCCFCIDLKTGVLVLGILSSIFTGISSIVYLVYFVGTLMGKKTGNDLSNFGFIDKASHEDFSAMINGRLAESIVGMIICVIYFVASILLSVGASKGNPKLLILWMIVSLVNIIWCIVSIILVFVLTASNDPRYNWGLFGTFVVSMLLTVYFEIVVLSLYNKLNNNSAPQFT